MSKHDNSQGSNTVSHAVILAADDSEDERFLLSVAFEKSALPHKLIFVNDGEAAIAYLHGDPPYANRDQFPFPDLLLLDINMPKATGFEVLEWMQRAGFQKPTTLMLSSNDLEVYKKKALALGAREYHVKDIEFDATVALLQSVSTRYLQQAA